MEQYTPRHRTRPTNRPRTNTPRPPNRVVTVSASGAASRGGRGATMSERRLTKGQNSRLRPTAPLLTTLIAEEFHTSGSVHARPHDPPAGYIDVRGRDQHKLHRLREQGLVIIVEGRRWQDHRFCVWNMCPTACVSGRPPSSRRPARRPPPAVNTPGPATAATSGSPVVPRIVTTASGGRRCGMSEECRKSGREPADGPLCARCDAVEIDTSCCSAGWRAEMRRQRVRAEAATSNILMIYKHNAVMTDRTQDSGARKAGYHSADAPPRLPMRAYNRYHHNRFCRTATQPSQRSVGGGA